MYNIIHNASYKLKKSFFILILLKQNKRFEKYKNIFQSQEG